MQGFIYACCGYTFPRNAKVSELCWLTFHFALATVEYR